MTTDTLSIAGNLAFMKGLIGMGHMNYLLANGITIAACSVLTFLVSNRFVIAKTPENQSA